MKTISPVELQQIFAAQPSSSVIDVRTPVEFVEVYVPQAQNIPLDELKPGSLRFQKDQPVYLLCRSGQRATKAAENLLREVSRSRSLSKAARSHGSKQIYR